MFSPQKRLLSPQKGLIDSGKQDVKRDSFIGQYDGVKVMWEGEYQVEVTAGEQFCFALIKPLFLCHRLTFRAMSIPT